MTRLSSPAAKGELTKWCCSFCWLLVGFTCKVTRLNAYVVWSSDGAGLLGTCWQSRLIVIFVLYFFRICTAWLLFFFFFSFFLGPNLQHLEVPRLGVEPELQLPAMATATAIAMPDPSNICNLYLQLTVMPIVKLLSEARDQTCILMDTIWVCYCWITMGTPVQLS